MVVEVSFRERSFVICQMNSIRWFSKTEYWHGSTIDGLVMFLIGRLALYYRSVLESAAQDMVYIKTEVWHAEACFFVFENWLSHCYVNVPQIKCTAGFLYLSAGLMYINW